MASGMVSIRTEGLEREETSRESSRSSVSRGMGTSRVFPEKNAGTGNGTGELWHVSQQATQDVVENVLGARSRSLRTNDEEPTCTLHLEKKLAMLVAAIFQEQAVAQIFGHRAQSALGFLVGRQR